MSSKPTILVVGTLDTKASQILFLREQILVSSNHECQVQILDVSRTAKDATTYPAFPAAEVISPLLEMGHDLSTMQRGEYVDKAIAICAPAVQQMVANSEIHGIVAAGGSSGSFLATAIMRQACPIGFPKLMVSTMASGDIKAYVEEVDITMMYSVVDISGINSILRRILSNAAGAIAGMVLAYTSQLKSSQQQKNGVGKRVAVTMFGVTTTCVDMIQTMLTTTRSDLPEYEVYVFHATGAGGRAMERLIEEGQIDAVVDLTTTEIADELIGGVLSAGPRRLEAAAKKGIPMIVSVGACDMVNFGPKDTVPPQFSDRKLYVHNPAVTLMRTTVDENRRIGEHIATQLKTHATEPSKIQVLLPLGGVSMIDTEGQPFFDREADTALFESIRSGLAGTEIQVQEHPENINTERFASKICEHLLDIMSIDPRTHRLANARRRQWSFDHGKSIQAIRRASFVEIPSIQ